VIYITKYKTLPKEHQHLAGVKLLSIGLKIEENIDYFKESIIVSRLGKPRLKNCPTVNYSVSHCKNYIACVISKGYKVGIDVEDVKDFSPNAAKKVCTKKELDKIYLSESPNTEFFKYWTLKESFVKAIGQGIFYKMKNIEFEEINKSNITSNQENYNFTLFMEDEYITAVCYRKI